MDQLQSCKKNWLKCTIFASHFIVSLHELASKTANQLHPSLIIHLVRALPCGDARPDRLFTARRIPILGGTS